MTRHDAPLRRPPAGPPRATGSSAGRALAPRLLAVRTFAVRTLAVGVLAIGVLAIGGCRPSPTGASPSGPDPDHRLPAPAIDESVPADGGARRAVFAGGCFWCIEAVFEELAGVSAVTSGYAGGSPEDANYDDVSAGRTDHAEAVEVAYDPKRVTYGALLRVFLSLHDPTQLDRQGPDHGHQYRSAVFPADDEQRRVAEAYLAQVRDAGAFDREVVTTVEPLDEFHPAEGYHQDFVRRNPGHPYVQRWALPKIAKVRELFPELCVAR